MGWAEDHILAVAARWKTKYQASGASPDEFGQRMKNVLISYGWTEAEADRIVEIATK